MFVKCLLLTTLVSMSTLGMGAEVLKREPSPSRFRHLRLLEVDSVNLEGWKTGHYRDPYLPEYSTGSGGEEWLGGVAVTFDITLLQLAPNLRLYWDNRIHTDGTRNQVRHVGWEWELGVNLGPKLDAYYEHHSQHCMECDPEQRFPLRDVYGLRFKLYERGK